MNHDEIKNALVSLAFKKSEPFCYGCYVRVKKPETGSSRCPKCGSGKVQRRGVAVAQTRTYLRYQCQSCGGWFRGNKSTSVNRSERGVNIQ